MAASGVFIVGAKRTAFGSFGGSLSRLSATDLAVASSKASLASAGIRPDLIDATFVGNVIQTSPDACYLARHVALKVGARMETPALTVNRLCGSGFETVIQQGAEAIQLGKASVALCAGAENMSSAPLVVAGNDARWGIALGSGLKMEDSLWAGLTDSYAGLPMGMTAENLGDKYGITREQCEEYSVLSQTRWSSGNANGAFTEEMAPIEVKTKKGPKVMDTDEHPRPSSVEKMAALRPVFKKDGVVTSATASGICDGAGSLLLAGESAVNQKQLTPLARVVATHEVGCDPAIMGIGPVNAIRGALQKAGLALADMDLVEVNEAFAVQYLAVEKELGLERGKTNTNGGAIALGHPLGASGSRIMAHLTHELRRKGLKYGVGAACIGGGQGIAVVIENVA
ncbi:unnamed protein product [Ectocarpus sp. 12 AP-2014]